MATQNEFGHAISILNRYAGAYFARRLKRYGIGPGQQAYLLALNPGEEIQQDTLAERLVVDKANVTRALTALEMLNLVHRAHAPDNRRTRRVGLTPHGIEVREKVETIARQWVTQLQNGISDDEWSDLVRMLGKITANATAIDPSE